MKKLGMWLWILTVIAGMLPVSTLAAETEAVRIPVRVQGEVKGRVYTVELEAVTRDAPMPEESREDRYWLELPAGQTGYFTIPWRKTGVFDYSIRQIPGTEPDCTYDRREYRLRLFATLTEAGEKETTALLLGQEGKKEPSAEFENHWAKPASVTLTAWKTMDGNTPEDGAFSFRLLAEDGELLYEVENKGRRVQFPELVFDREGTYRFFVKEAAGGNRKILYDRTVYTVTVTVIKDMDFRASVSFERNGKPWAGILSFANYTDTGSPKTGDTIDAWIGVMGISAFSLAVLWLCRKRP